MTSLYARLRPAVLLLALVLTIPLTALANPSTAAPPEPISVLTVGNSFAWNATHYLDDFAEAAGREIVIQGVNLSGHSLEQHAKRDQAYAADPTDPEGRAYGNPTTGKRADLSLREALASREWDVVTIQQASPLSFRPESYEPFAGALIATIREFAPSAEILVHQTWAYRADHALFQKADGFTQQVMFERLRNAYAALAERYNLRIIPVGQAFQNARSHEHWKFTFPDKSFDYKNPPQGATPDQPGDLIVGWNWITHRETGLPHFWLDAIHANEDGKYLAAAVWFETLFNLSVVDNPFVPEGMDPATARELREIAHTTTQTQ